MAVWRDNAARLHRAGRRAFGEDASLTPGLGRPQAGVTISGFSVVFDEAYQLTGAAEGQGVSDTAPVAEIRLGDLPAGVVPYRGDGLQVKVFEVWTSWTITDVQPDGHGIVMAILREA